MIRTCESLFSIIHTYSQVSTIILNCLQLRAAVVQFNKYMRKLGDCMSDDLSIGERIAELAAAQKINLKELSRKADVPYTTLYAIVNRKSNRVQKSTLHCVARALGVSVGSLTGTGSIFLNDVDSNTFKKRAKHYFELLNADLNNLQNTGLYTYLHLDDDNYRPTKDDVVHFSEDTGLSIAYLVGSEDGDSEAIKPKLSVEGFNDVDIALCERHIRKFIADDLKQVLCSPEDAEDVTVLLLKHIGAEELIPFAKIVNFIADDYRKAAFAVLKTGVEETLRKKGEEKGLKIYSTVSHGEQEFAVYATDRRTDGYLEYPIISDANFEEALFAIDDYQTENKKTPQDQNDPETKE